MMPLYTRYVLWCDYAGHPEYQDPNHPCIGFLHDASGVGAAHYPDEEKLSRESQAAGWLFRDNAWPSFLCPACHDYAKEKGAL